MPGDLLAITVLETTPRVPYGVISNRHGRGALPGELPRGAGERQRLRARCATSHGCLPAVEGGERADRVPARARSSGSWASRWPATSARTRCRPARTAATSTSTCCRSAPRSTCRCRCRARWPTWATRTSRRATARWRSPRWRRRCGSRCGSTWSRRSRRSRSSDRSRGRSSETPEYLVPTGLDKDLDEAVRRCVRAALALLQARWGLDEHLAYAYLSAATDFDISQVVDQVCGRARPDPRGRLRRGRPDERPGRPAGGVRRLRARARRRRRRGARRRVRARPGRRCAATATACSSGTTPSARSAAPAAASRRACWTASSPAARRRLLADRRDLPLRGRRHRAADAGVAAGRRPLAHHRRARHRPDAELRQVRVAHGRRPALPGRVRRSAAGAAGRGQGRVRRPRATGSARATRPGCATRPASASTPRRCSTCSRRGASVRGLARTDELAYSIAGANPHYGTPANGAVAGRAARAARPAGRRPRSPPGRRTSGWPATPPARSASRRATRACGGCAPRTGWCRGRAWCRSRRRSTRSAG